MKTAIELAAEMHKFGVITFNRWALDGAAMLRTLAQENQELKADAERQEAKVKALRDSLNWALSNISEEPYEWSSEEDADAHNAAIEAAKETP